MFLPDRWAWARGGRLLQDGLGASCDLAPIGQPHALGPQDERRLRGKDVLNHGLRNRSRINRSSIILRSEEKTMLRRSLFISLLVLTLVLSGCKAPTTEAPPPPTQPPAAATEAPKPAPTEVPTEAPEPVTLIFWSHWAEESNKKEVLMAAAEKF